MKRKSLLIALVLGTSTLAHADQNPRIHYDLNYFTITRVETHEIPTVQPEAVPPSFETPADPILGGVDLSQIVNLGKTLWSLIEANKPVVNITTNQANALPKGVADWTSLAGWQVPQAHTFQTTFTNAYGMDVVIFQFRLTFTPGGNYNGKGLYLANVNVVPSTVQVDWGYTFNAQVTVPTITNAGSVDSPVGAAEVTVKWSVDTFLKHTEQSADFYMRGDGAFQQLQ